MWRGVPDAAHHADPAGGQRQGRLEQGTELGPVVVGDHDVGGTVHKGRIERGSHLVGRHLVGHRYGIDEYRAEAEVVPEVQEVPGDRRREDGDERAPVERSLADTVREITNRIGVSHTPTLDSET